MQVATITTEGINVVPTEDLQRLLKTENVTVWVDMIGPTDEHIRVMREVFQFHQLAIDDTRNQEQRPKIEEYANYLFIILNPVDHIKENVDFRELDVFIGPNFVVTVHPHEEPVIEQARLRLQGSVALPPTASSALYAMMDVVIDGYFPILDHVGEEVEELEDLILVKPNTETMNRLFHLKRSLLEMWRIIWPQREIFNILMQHNLPYLDQRSLQYYLRDVSDHLMWIADMVNTLRDTLTSLIDLHMSSVSNRLNKVVNRLTVMTIVIGVFTVISGFYGMNFEQTWPPFSAPWGVPFVLGLMTFAAAVVVAIFRKLNWL
jgi:magnesium transporter